MGELHSWLPFIVRALVGVSTQTFFQPDEYFQSLEPAHHAVFGYGHLTWEWKTNPPIRTILFPSVFIPIYHFLKLTGLDETKALIVLPKLCSGLMAGFTDYFTFKLARRLLGPNYAPTALFVSLASFFHTLSLSRSFSNSWETTLTIAAIYYWPLSNADFTRQNFRSHVRLCLVLAALAVLIRPTSMIVWIFMGAQLLFSAVRHGRLVELTIDVASVGSIFSAILFATDTVYYGFPTFTPLNFVRVNTSSVALFYGSNPFHYYITQALPVLCTTSLPFVAHGMFKCWRTQHAAHQKLVGLCMWTIAIYSVAGHKEWRFIHPILPLLHIFASKSLVDHYQSSQAPEADRLRKSRSWGVNVGGRHIAFLLLSIPASAYVMFFHGRAQIAVMHQLRSTPPSDLRSVGFLMPCHSTPTHSYLHRPDLEVWSIGCEPPLQNQNLGLYRDQTRVFYESPVQYLESRFPAAVDPTFPRSPYPCNPPGISAPQAPWNHTWTSHLVLFGALVDDTTQEGRQVKSILQSRGYAESWGGINGFEEDERRRGGVQIWRWAPKRA